MSVNTTIITHSGVKVDLTSPTISVPIEDIAHALAYQPRFGCHLNCRVLFGKVLKFYSIAHHSLRVSELAPREWALEALLHDAHEALMGDIPTPVKEAMQCAGVDVRRFETQIQQALRPSLGLPRVPDDEALKVVSEVDHRALLEEIPACFSAKAFISWYELGYEFDPNFRYPEIVGPEIAKQRFVARYHQLTQSTDRRTQPLRQGRDWEVAAQELSAQVRGIDF